MGIALIKLKIMPVSPSEDLEKIKQKAEKILRDKGAKGTGFVEEPIAFGLKAIIASFNIDESEELEPLEEELGKISGLPVEPDTYIGGLCDLPGELYRYAIKSATAKKFPMVEKCYKISEEIIGELMDMDLTGYNRNKFDQAKGALHKLEQVVYEVSLRK